MSDPVDRAQRAEEHSLEVALANRKMPEKVKSRGRCLQCDGLNDRPDYAVCSDCVEKRKP